MQVLKDLMAGNMKALTIEALKFSVDSYNKIKKLEASALESGVVLDPAKLKCLLPVDTNVTPVMEFKKTTNSNWVLFEHGKFVCVFSEDFLKTINGCLPHIH